MILGGEGPCKDAKGNPIPCKEHGLKMVDDTKDEIIRNDVYNTYKPSSDISLSQNPYLYEKSFYNAVLNNKKGLPNDYINTMNDDYGYNVNQAIFDAQLQTGSYKKSFDYNPLKMKKTKTFNNIGLTYKHGGNIYAQGGMSQQDLYDYLFDDDKDEPPVTAPSEEELQSQDDTNQEDNDRNMESQMEEERQYDMAVQIAMESPVDNPYRTRSERVSTVSPGNPYTAAGVPYTDNGGTAPAARL